MWTLDTIQKVGQVDAAVWMRILRLMLLSRKADERLIRLYHQGQIRGSVFASIGQEAIGATTVEACGPDDLFAPCIRNMTVHLGRGESVLGVFRQAMARAGGPTGGRDGNVHYGRLANGVFAMISHLGAMLSVVTGGVMARRRQGMDAVGVAYMGDGATSTGDFHEALNFAAVFGVPVLFVIENNHYAYSTPTSRQYRCRRLADRAVGYGIRGFTADGNNAGEMYVMAKDIVDDIRANPRPVILECDTMRMRGHGEHDSFAYVQEGLLDVYGRRDPIVLALRGLRAGKLVSDEELDELDRECAAEVDNAYQQALAEPEPAAETLRDGVYTDA